MRIPRVSLAALAAVTLLAAGCGGEETTPPAQWPDGSVLPDRGIIGPSLDGRANDLGAPPDLEVNAEGPTIEILEPKADTILVGELIKVRVKISDPDGVDDQTVKAQPAGRDAQRMIVTASPGIYEALIDVASLGENVRLWVEASDLQGNGNKAYRDLTRDPGPLIQVNSPPDESRHKGSVSLQVIVADPYGLTSFVARIGSVDLELKKTDLGQGRTMYVGSVKFDDDAFNPPLSGEQVISISAENKNGARSSVERKFFVDDAGPSITVSSQSPGELIGGVIQIAVSVADPAGVVASTVKCVIGNDLDKRTVLLKSTDGASFTGQFDSRTLTPFDLWPVMSFRAADTLGNESHREFQVGLDNGPPTLSLDPSKAFFWGIDDEDKGLQCSHPFDPVGEDAASDLELVPQVMPFRVRIEDHGNHVPSAPWVPISMIDASTTRMYLLDETAQALVVDSTGDGFCDSINPNVVPLGSAPAPGQAVAVDLVPIPPAGDADFFTPYAGPLPSPDCSPGEAEEPPEPLCNTTVMTKVIPFTRLEGSSEPVIYSIPPVAAGFQCVGLPFDFLANSFDDGWTCVAAEASDLLGNASVSRPIRVWVDKAALTSGPLPGTAGSPPSCTGTLLPDGSADASKPCKFRPWAGMFPQDYPEIELHIVK